MTVEFHIPLDAHRQQVAVELQGMLVDLVDLTLIGKHAHWNVEGRHFRSVHRELDELVDAWRVLADDVAERAATIGASPDGQAEAIAEATELAPLAAGRLGDRYVLDAIGERVADVSIRTGERIERVAVTDPVTCDLLVRVAGTLEKQLWMTRAQITDAVAATVSRTVQSAKDFNGARRS